MCLLCLFVANSFEVSKVTLIAGFASLPESLQLTRPLDTSPKGEDSSAKAFFRVSRRLARPWTLTSTHAGRRYVNCSNTNLYRIGKAQSAQLADSGHRPHHRELSVGGFYDANRGCRDGSVCRRADPVQRFQFKSISTQRNRPDDGHCTTWTRRLLRRRPHVRAPRDSYPPHSTPAQVLNLSPYSTMPRATSHSPHVFPIHASERMPGAGVSCAA